MTSARPTGHGANGTHVDAAPWVRRCAGQMWRLDSAVDGKSGLYVAMRESLSQTGHPVWLMRKLTGQCRYMANVPQAGEVWMLQRDLPLVSVGPLTWHQRALNLYRVLLGDLYG